MARKDQLREQRTGTVINLSSKKQEETLGKALKSVVASLEGIFSLRYHHEKDWKLADIVARLRTAFPEVEFYYTFESSNMRPDGGILSIEDDNGRFYPILIVEVKNQGTNDLRLKEGKPIQAKGNAIERLGKNVIGLRTALLAESIFPFVCFGYGYDFREDSSIRDRVVTIGMFGQLNQIHIVNEGTQGQFNRGSFFFREEAWTFEEMKSIMLEIAQRSIYYYFSKYGAARFEKT
ncbi:MAG: hypothetical protein OXC99_10905 [Chloroflexi bacterium]|nr:hypothetical protein [Chloroflexota bacterium]